MNLNLPKKNTFWAAVVIAALGVVVYIMHLVGNDLYLFPKYVPYLQPIAFLLVVAAFVMLCLGLTLKGF